MTRLRGLLLFSAWVASLALSIVGIAGRSNFFLGTAFNVLHWPMLLLLVLSAGALFRRRRSKSCVAALLGAVLIVGELLWVEIGQARAADQGENVGSSLRLLNHNVLFRGGNQALTMKAMSEKEVDIATFQEVTPEWAEKLQKVFLGKLRYSAIHPHRGTHGLAIFSRYPISEVEIFNNREGRAVAQCASLRVREEPVDICNVHIASPAIVVERPANFLTGLAANAVQRREEWLSILRYLENRKRGHAQLVVGDVNTLEWDPLYGQITRDFVDAFRHIHWGIGATFPNQVAKPPFPLFRIDYLFVRGPILPVACDVLPEGGSDHFPISATLDLFPVRQRLSGGR